MIIIIVQIVLILIFRHIYIYKLDYQRMKRITVELI